MTTNQPFRRLFSRAAATLALTVRRATMTLLVMMLMTATAWATNESVSYIDGNGNSQNVNATVVTTDMEGTDIAKFVASTYPWLYVKNSVTLDGGYNNGFVPINIILGDGATLTVKKWLRFENASVNIYCQSGGTGKLVVNGSYENAATFKINNTHTLTIYGGTVEVTNNAQDGDAFSGSSLVMNGGTATFNAPTGTNSYGIYANVAFNGGNLTATGWLGVQGDATLNHKATTDRISCSSYGGSVTIADGKYFKDSSGKVYAGTLTNDEKTSIASQTLQPATQREYTVYCLLKNFSGTGTALDPYVISTTDAWDAFCNALDGDDTWSYFCDKSWKLGKNITVSRMAGSGAGGNLTESDRPFCGTFDGGGNTLTFNYGSSGSPADENNLAPFRYVNNATIRHLHVSGDIYTQHAHAGGIIGMAYGTTNITDCHSSVNIHSSINGDGTHGGIMACSWTGSTTNIEGCLFDGSIQSASGYATDQCGGFVGWRNATINVTNSLLTADLTTIGAATGQQYPSATFVRNGEANRITNSYYTTTLGTAQGKQRRSITAGEYVTVENAGTPVLEYTTSGITAYPTGIKYKNVLYAGNGDNVSLTLGNNPPEGFGFNGYTTTGGTLTGTDNPYTLTMPNADVEIGATFELLPDAIPYLDMNGQQRYCVNSTPLTSSMTTIGTASQETWYVADGTINFTSEITVQGNVHLILKDGAMMNVGTESNPVTSNGINADGNSFSIYAQSTGASKGQLQYVGSKKGFNASNSGSVTINGGQVSATGSNGIYASSSGSVTINGGEVTATGTSSSIFPYGGSVTINGGQVTATGRNGINAQGTVTINGGQVTAIGDLYGIFITNKNNIIGSVTISGGQVTTIGDTNGINASSGSVTLGWTNATDFILASSYQAEKNGSISIAEGKTFVTEDGATYTGTLTGTDALATLAGKTLRPYSDNSDVSRSLLVLADNADNAAIISKFNGQAYNVTLAGRTLYKDGKWNTLCLPFALSAEQIASHTDFSGATLMELDTDGKNGFDPTDGTLYLTFKTATAITAGTPYLVKWDVAGTDFTSPTFSGVTIAATASTTVSDVDGDLQEVQMVGCYSPVPVVADDKSILYLGDANTLYYSSIDRDIRSCRAYFSVPYIKQNAGAKARAFRLDFGDGEQTGIMTVQGEGFTVNGADAWYTLDGRKLDGKPATKGLYINGGKKVVIK